MVNNIRERLKQPAAEPTRGICVQVPASKFEAVSTRRRKDNLTMTQLITKLIDLYLEAPEETKK